MYIIIIVIIIGLAIVKMLDKKAQNMMMLKLKFV